MQKRAHRWFKKKYIIYVAPHIYNINILCGHIYIICIVLSTGTGVGILKKIHVARVGQCTGWQVCIIAYSK